MKIAIICFRTVPPHGSSNKTRVNRAMPHRDDWNGPINLMYNKIDVYITQHNSINDICVATSVWELCESRDSEYTNLFDRNETLKCVCCYCLMAVASILLLYINFD